MDKDLLMMSCSYCSNLNNRVWVFFQLCSESTLNQINNVVHIFIRSHPIDKALTIDSVTSFSPSKRCPSTTWKGYKNRYQEIGP